MSSIIPTFDPTQDWTSPAGLNIIKSLVEPYLSFEPRDFQVYDSGCILNGQDVFCISATGDGKSALIYIPALVRKEMITVVVEPTNALENNMASNLQNKGLTSIVINAEEIEEAKAKGRNLWDKAKDGRYQVVALSPEMLKSQEYAMLNDDPYFRQRWRVLAVDEAHLVDHWGTDFRKAYADIWTLRSRGPEHLTFVAMSASVEKGAQMTRILRRLGYREDAFHLDKRDCQRHNVDLIFRTMQFPSTGFEFRDLDWLVPPDLASASDVPKRIVYSDTIEMGHRITGYLRGLLPTALQSASYTLIRHMHSMNCSECKKEGLAALVETGSERKTAIFVATAVWEVGLDVPDIAGVILFPAPASASSIIQRAGCPARAPGMRGEAIVYVKKTDIEAALEYAGRDPPDSRLLDPKNLLGCASLPSRTQEALESQPIANDMASEGDGCHVADNGQETAAESDARDVNAQDSDTVIVRAGTVAAETDNVHNTVPLRTVKPPRKSMSMAKGNGKSSKMGGKKQTNELPHSEQGKRLCFARHLIIAAHARSLCITRQINIVYDNPGTDHNCGCCSSCLPRPLPAPRPMPSPIPDTAESTPPPSDNAPDAVTLPAYMKLTRAEVEELSQELNRVSRRVWRKTICGPESLLIGPSSFLRPDVVKDLTVDFHLLSSVQDLERRIRHHWRYWDTASSELWSELVVLVERFHEKAEARHQQSLENQREARERRGAKALHDEIMANGLGHIKRVRLVVPETSSAFNNSSQAAEDPATSLSISSHVAPVVMSPPVFSLPTSANARTSTPDPMPTRLVPPVLSPSNRATGSSPARSHVDHVLGQSIPAERFYGTSQTRKRGASPGHSESEQRPAKVPRTSRGRKVAGGMVQTNSAEGKRPRKENAMEKTASRRRAKQGVRS